MQRDLVREYLQYLQVEKGLAKNSLESYERDLAKLKNWAEKNDYDVINLSRQDLREFLIDLSIENLSPNSVNRIISAIRGFYKFLQFDRHITKNPAEHLEAQTKGFYLPKFLNQMSRKTMTQCMRRNIITTDFHAAFFDHFKNILTRKHSPQTRNKKVLNLDIFFSSSNN